jgi:AraC-like DNA-binding protein
MQQYNKLEYNYITHWAARPKWTTSQFAHLLCGREPPTSDWREERGLGQTNWGAEYKRALEVIILWLENDLNMLDVREYTEATPSEFIGLATRYGYDVPMALIEAVKKCQKSTPGNLSQQSKQTVRIIKDSKKQSRENALHTELERLFIEWGKPATNKECWDQLKGINFLERDSVIQEVVHVHNDRGKCQILWQSQHGHNCKPMKRATFDNRMGIIREKFHG